jgi:hypothetical protein
MIDSALGVAVANVVENTRMREWVGAVTNGWLLGVDARSSGQQVEVWRGAIGQNVGASQSASGEAPGAVHTSGWRMCWSAKVC